MLDTKMEVHALDLGVSPFLLSAIVLQYSQVQNSKKTKNTKLM
jgi:hypothetical protein